MADKDIVFEKYEDGELREIISDAVVNLMARQEVVDRVHENRRMIIRDIWRICDARSGAIGR